jgi:hypothetical protein
LKLLPNRSPGIKKYPRECKCSNSAYPGTKGGSGGGEVFCGSEEGG